MSQILSPPTTQPAIPAPCFLDQAGFDVVAEGFAGPRTSVLLLNAAIARRPKDTLNDNCAASLAKARLGRGCVLFEIADHGAVVRCSVSEAAIQDASGCWRKRSSDLLQQFSDLRPRIMAAALRKLRFHSPLIGVLHVWSEDLDDDPMPEVPAVALAVPA